jgi:hypothetical protein
MNAMFRVITTHLAKLEVKSGVLVAEEEFMLAMASEYHNQLLAQTDDTLGQGLNRLLEAQPNTINNNNNNNNINNNNNNNNNNTTTTTTTTTTTKLIDITLRKIMALSALLLLIFSYLQSHASSMTALAPPVLVESFTLVFGFFSCSTFCPFIFF